MIDLTLKLEDKTVRKLRALAMLSGKTVGNLEKEFSSFFDKMLTQEIAKYLEIEVGGASAQSILYPEVGSTDEEVGEETEPAESAGEVFGDLSHSLSGDEDEGQESLAEQYEREMKGSPQEPVAKEVRFEETSERDGGISFHINAPNAGEDAEAFLDETLGSPEYQDEYDIQRRADRPVQAKLSGSGRRARVADFTGYESNSF